MTKPSQVASLPLLPLAALLSFSAMSPISQAQTQPSLNRNVIVLDAAHGGADTGARIADNLPEKQVTLAFAARLKSLLTAAGFTVLMTREADPTDPPTTDQRASSANRARALACVLIHATPSGTGVHVFTSSLAASESSGSTGGAGAADSAATLPWDSAQTSYFSLSVRLANELGVALLHANIPPLLSHASIRPIDTLTCPAVALEIAPLAGSGSDPTPVSDAVYQQNAAKAITEGLASWRNHAAAPAKAPTPKPVPPPTPAAPAPATPASGAQTRATPASGASR